MTATSGSAASLEMGDLVLGVDTSAPMLEAPDGATTVGVLWPADAGDTMPDNLADTVIALKVQGIHVIMEIPTSASVDFGTVLRMSSNVGFSVSALPPDRVEDTDSWKRNIRSLTRAFFEVPNFDQTAFPVSVFMASLVSETYGGHPKYSDQGSYMDTRFIDACSPDALEDAFAFFKSDMSDMLGGDAAVRSFIDSIIRGSHKEAEAAIVKRADKQSGQ